MTCPTSCPRPTQPHPTSPIPQHVPSPHHEHTATLLYHYHTTPDNANNTSTIQLWLKCNACSLIHKLLITSYIPRHIQHNPYPSWLIINSSHHRQFLRWGTSHSAKCTANFCATYNAHTLYKSGQCSPMHILFSNCWVSYDRWDFQPSIHMEITRNFVSYFIWQTIQKCQLFLRHPVYIYVCLSAPAVVALKISFPEPWHFYK